MEIMIESKLKIAPDEVYRKGEEIYAKIKHQYLPQHRGNFLVIEVESGKAYMDDSFGKAAERAMTENPGKPFLHSVRIGFKYTFFLVGMMASDEMVD